MFSPQITFESPVGDRGALVLDDAYLWTTNDDASATVLDGDNEVLESTGTLVCDVCQVRLQLLCLKFQASRNWTDVFCCVTAE